MSFQSYYEKAWCDYRGLPIHMLQIGLGTFGTFLDKSPNWVHTLLDAVGYENGDTLFAIGVDPVAEVIASMEAVVVPEYPGVSILQAAVGNSRRNVECYSLCRLAKQSLPGYMCRRRIPNWIRRDIEHDMLYLENMSCVENKGQEFFRRLKSVEKRARTSMSLVSVTSVPMYTFSDVLRYYGAGGCKVLLVDAEGSDCAILHSMIDACQANRFIWPLIVQFETRGHAGVDEEKAMIWRLLDFDYVLLDFSGDATLVLRSALNLCPKLRWWADSYFSYTCVSCRWYFPPSRCKSEMSFCGFSHWWYTNKFTQDGYRRWEWYCLRCSYL